MKRSTTKQKFKPDLTYFKCENYFYGESFNTH